jgi:hypothetical protein
VNTDDSPAPPDDAAERFAAAVEGDVAVDTADPELARELEIAKMLTRQGGAYDPEPEARARARQRLMAALAEEVRDGPSRAS